MPSPLTYGILITYLNSKESIMTIQRMGELFEVAIQWSLPVLLIGMWVVS